MVLCVVRQQEWIKYHLHVFWETRIISSEIILDNGLLYLARWQKTLGVFSAEESHGIERITQEIKGLDDEKEGTQKLATPKDQEATITLKWEGLRVRIPYKRSGPWKTIGKLELELQRDTVAARNATSAARRKKFFFPLSFYLTFLALSIDHPPKPAGIEKCTLKRFGGGARRTSRSPQGQDEHGHNWHPNSAPQFLPTAHVQGKSPGAFTHHSIDISEYQCLISKVCMLES